MLKRIIDRYKSVPVQIRAAFWFLVCSFMQRGISVITTPIFTRLLTTGDYGQYGVFNSWLDIISIFVTLRLYYGVFARGLIKFEDDKASYASSMQGLELVLCLFWTVVYILFHDFWNMLFKLTTVQMLAMMLMIWAAGAFRFWATEQRNVYRYRMLVAVTLTVSLLKPALGILLVIHAEDKVTARILGLCIAELIGYSWCFFIQMARGKQFYSAKYWKHALMFNLPLIPHYLSQTVLASSDRIMIREFVGASEAGIYTLAYSISKIMFLFNRALTQTLTPWIYRKIRDGRAQDIASATYPALIGIAGINLFLIAFAPEAVTIFAPKSYHSAIWVIPPVTMSVFFQFGYHLFACFEFYYDKTRFAMVASVISAFANVLLNYIFIRRYGYQAAGYTTLFCYILFAAGHYLFMRRICNEVPDGQVVYRLKPLLLISGTFVAIGFLFLFLYRHWYLRYFAIGVLLAFCVWNRQRICDILHGFLDIGKSRREKTVEGDSESI